MTNINIITLDDVRVEVIAPPLTHAHVQPTAVRVVHLSSGASVTHDSQHRNRSDALVTLTAKVEIQKILNFVGVQIVNESRKFEPNAETLDTLESIENFIKNIVATDTPRDKSDAEFDSNGFCWDMFKVPSCAVDVLLKCGERTHLVEKVTYVGDGTLCMSSPEAYHSQRLHSFTANGILTNYCMKLDDGFLLDYADCEVVAWKPRKENRRASK